MKCREVEAGRRQGKCKGGKVDCREAGECWVECWRGEVRRCKGAKRSGAPVQKCKGGVLGGVLSRVPGVGRVRGCKSVKVEADYARAALMGSDPMMEPQHHMGQTP